MRPLSTGCSGTSRPKVRRQDLHSAVVHRHHSCLAGLIDLLSQQLAECVRFGVSSPPVCCRADGLSKRRIQGARIEWPRNNQAREQCKGSRADKRSYPLSATLRKFLGSKHLVDRVPSGQTLTSLGQLKSPLAPAPFDEMSAVGGVNERPPCVPGDRKMAQVSRFNADQCATHPAHILVQRRDTSGL